MKIRVNVYGNDFYPTEIDENIKKLIEEMETLNSFHDEIKVKSAKARNRWNDLFITISLYFEAYFDVPKEYADEISVYDEDIDDLLFEAVG